MEPAAELRVIPCHCLLKSSIGNTLRAGILAVNMEHMIFTAFGQMHEKTALSIKNFARIIATKSGTPPSTTISRALESLGVAICVGLGGCLEMFNFRCAPLPSGRAHLSASSPAFVPSPAASPARSSRAVPPLAPEPIAPLRLLPTGTQSGFRSGGEREVDGDGQPL